VWGLILGLRVQEVGFNIRGGGCKRKHLGSKVGDLGYIVQGSGLTRIVLYSSPLNALDILSHKINCCLGVGPFSAWGLECRV